MTATQPAADCRERSVWHALAAAAALLLAARLGYGLLESHYARAFHSVPIPRGSLDRLPLEVGEWQGRTQPMKDTLLKATDTDDHVSREYRSRKGLGAVSLWIGYGGRLRDLMPHRPEICYPGHGYTLEGEQQVQLRASDGTSLPCRVLRFSRGGFQTERIAVLNYYLLDGEYSPDVSLLRSKAMRVHSGGRYMVQVQISCAYDALSGLPDAPVRRFAEASAATIRETVQSAVHEVEPPIGQGRP